MDTIQRLTPVAPTFNAIRRQIFPGLSPRCVVDPSENYFWRVIGVQKKFSHLSKDISQSPGEWCTAIGPQGKDIAPAHRCYIHITVQHTKEAAVIL